MLTGRWWEGRILINLCGKKNDRNCDLLQSDFFARCRTVLWVAKGCFWHVVKLGQRWGPETLCFFTLEKHATKSHLPTLISRASRSDISGQGKLGVLGTACYKFMSVKNTPLPQEHWIYSTPYRRTVHAYSPSKCCDHASQKQDQTAKCLANPLELPTLPRQFVPDWLMIAFITYKSSLVPLLQGLCTSNPCRSEDCFYYCS